MMRAESAPRKVYSRNGVTHICFQGLYFKPAKGQTKIDPEREVNHIEALDRAGGKARIALHQKVGGKTITETWLQTEVPVQGHRKKQGRKRASRVPSATA